MKYKKINNEVIGELKKIVGGDNIILDKEKMVEYSHDEFSLNWVQHFPEVVVKPKDKKEISQIMKLANKERFPVTPRGAGTGLVAGCVPVYGGAVLSLARMNKVWEIDKRNLMATVEPGVTLMDFYEKVESSGLFFPPHPGDETAFIGGAIATNAGGARAVKYGVMRDFVKGLEIVLPNGEILELGGKLMKNCTGYSLLHLMIGSEGTLGIITKAVILLMPPLKSVITLIVPYDSLHDAIKTAPEIILAGIRPITIEFIQSDVIPPAEKMLGKKWPSKKGKAFLMIIVDGPTEDEVSKLSEKIAEVCMGNNAKDILVAESKKKQADILAIRSNLYESLKPNLIETLDLTIPLSEIVNHIDKVNEISEEYGVWLPSYGHAGDGNVHTHIMKLRKEKGKFKVLEEEEWKEKYPIIRELLHEDCIKRGGVISGEHCIGVIKKEYVPMALSNAHLGMLRKIKRAFDPNNILNPGKMFDL
ncbi:FAD-binding oxidoreductase [Candidatus Aerophobetes bacterium]|nr:FAD-binding oxidoreductase [Candidatus Aerophobetes bacterium]